MIMGFFHFILFLFSIRGKFAIMIKIARRIGKYVETIYSRSGLLHMLKMHEIREIIKLIDQSGITHFELENEGDKLLIRKENVQTVQLPKVTEFAPVVTATSPVQEVNTQIVETESVSDRKVEAVDNATAQDDEAGLVKITSPMVGTFYEASNPNAKPYVSVGDFVDKSTIVCIVEAMKLFNEIEAEVKGKIVKVLVENGQLVEYGQPLFLVKPE